MNLLWLVLQEHVEGETPNVFAFSESVSFWTLVIFLILLGVLAKFAFPPILGYAAAREKRIQDQLDEAKQQRAETAALLEQQRQELAAAKQEAGQLLAEARVAGEKLRSDMLARSRDEGDALVERAKQEIGRERERAVEAVRREAVDLAIAAASKLIEKRLSADEDRRLVSDYLGRAADAGAN